jgi:hypothetical protein
MLASWERIFRVTQRILGIGLQGQTHPKEALHRLKVANAKSAFFKLQNELTSQEEMIFDGAILHQLTKRYSDDEDYFEAALAELRVFQAKQSELRGRPEKEVNFVLHQEWPEFWNDERCLTLIFRPELDEHKEYQHIKEDWSSADKNKLGIVANFSDFTINFGDYCKCDVNYIEIYGRSTPYQWRGSGIEILESDCAEQFSGQSFSSSTSLSANQYLARQTYLFLVSQLKSPAIINSGAKYILLVCAFPGLVGRVPRRRPVKPNERVRNPDHIKADTKRIRFELVGVFESQTEPVSHRVEYLARWMAVEN